MKRLHDDPTCKRKGCNNIVKYGISQGKVFCSKKCHYKHRREFADAGKMPSAFEMLESEVIDRRTALKKALAGDKSALKELRTRWGLKSIWNPATQQEIRI